MSRLPRVEEIYTNHKIINLKSSRDSFKKENKIYSLFEKTTKTTLELRIDWDNDYHMAVEVKEPTGPKEIADALDYLRSKIIYHFKIGKEENSGKKS